MKAKNQNMIAVLDFGSQYAHLIARRLRELKIHSVILEPDEVKDIDQYAGLILSGGPHSVYEDEAPKIPTDILKAGIPILGICYGHQLLSTLLGGEVSPGKVREFGRAEIELKEPSPLTKGLETTETVWMSHGDKVKTLPQGFQIIASTKDCPTAIIGHVDQKIYGLQFHPEVTDTPNGITILKNFALNICAAPPTWTVHSYLDRIRKEIKTQVGGRKVFLLVSGGVDSLVAFILLNKVLGPDRVLGLHIDNGFMRQHESQEVADEIKKLGLDNFQFIDSSSQFLNAVKGVIEPEEKRAAIGKTFVDVFADQLKKLNLDQKEWLLGQGTIYPDTIESGLTKHAAKIKTHHNRVPLIQEMIKKGLVIEPLKELYKDEVRQLGLELGLPKKLVYRHPFPGPGLAVQTLCAKKAEPLANKSQVEKSIAKFIDRPDLTLNILSIKSVGVQGDFRTYAHPLAIAGKASWGKLEKLSTAIANRYREINRVIYLLMPEKLEPFKVKEAYLTKDRLDLLRQAHSITNNILLDHNLYQKIWEMPIVLLPLSPSGAGESIVLRPLLSENAMTIRFAQLPKDIVDQIADEILTLPGIEAVFYDVTNKPPATVQWE